MQTAPVCFSSTGRQYADRPAPAGNVNRDLRPGTAKGPLTAGQTHDTQIADKLLDHLARALSC